MDAENERARLLSAIYELASLIHQTTDPTKLAEYVEQFDKLRVQLVLTALASNKNEEQSKSQNGDAY